MKRVILSVFIMIVLVWSCSEAFCKGRTRGGSRQRGVAAQKRKVSTRQGGERERTRERNKGKTFSEGKGRQRQMSAFERQLRRDEAKHRWRLARLKRIRRLAVEAENSEVIKRVDELLIKERNRYERRLGEIGQQMEKVLRAIEEGDD